MTLSLAAVFIPVLFMGGILGRLLHEFAVTISVAILVSGFVSLSLTPMLCSRFLRASKETEHGRLWQALRELLRRAATALRSHPASYASAQICHHGGFRRGDGGHGLSVRGIPKGFLPDEDQGQIFIFTEGPQGISFDNMVEHQRALNKVVMAQPYIDSFMSTAARRQRRAALFARLEAAQPARRRRRRSFRTCVEAGCGSRDQCLSANAAAPSASAGS